MICGLAFPEVIANAKRMATGQAADDARAHVLEESAQELQSLASQPQPDPAAINRVADRVRNLSAHVESDDARLSALNALQSAAVTLNDPKEKAATIDRIKDVGVAAAARKDLSTTVRALNTIQALEARSEFAPVQDQLHRAQAELLQSVPAEARAGGDFVAVLPAEAASGQSPQ